MSRIEELEKRLAADPNSRIFVQLAEEYRKQGLLDNAIEICEQGLTKHPQYPSARVALGRALLEAESFDRASEQFESVLATVPDNILANKFLGETYHRLGRYDEAIQKYQIAQTLAPEDTELEGKIEAVRAEMAGGGPPKPPAVPDPADVTAPADPSEYASAPPPPAAPPPMDAPLEPTLADGQSPTPMSPEAPPVPPVPPAPVAPVDPVAPTAADPLPTPGQDDAPPSPPKEELAPIPLVDVDEPMVLETAAESFARAGQAGQAEQAERSAGEPPPTESHVSAEPVPLMSPSEPPPVEPPPPMEPPPMEPPPMEPLPMEPLPMEPLPTEPAASAFEPPPMVEAPPMEPPSMESFEADPVEPLPVEAASLEPDPFVAAPPGREPTPEVDASRQGIETPTMAELYASQGHFEKAVNVYRNLLARDPNETQYLERIEELEMLAKASADSAGSPATAAVEPRGDGLSESTRQETIEVLEKWLDGIRRSRRA